METLTGGETEIRLRTNISRQNLDLSLRDFKSFGKVLRRDDVIMAYHKQGDLLCSKIMEFLDTRQYSHPEHIHLLTFPSHVIRDILDSTDIADKLLTRKMKREEYEGLLNGELPFGHYSGTDYYLPKPEKRIFVH